MSDEDLKSDLAQNMEYVGVAEDSGFASISGAVPVNDAPLLSETESLSTDEKTDDVNTESDKSIPRNFMRKRKHPDEAEVKRRAEEKRLAQEQLNQAQEQYNQEVREQRYKRLMHLLGRSQFYSSYLVKKIDEAMPKPKKSAEKRKAQNVDENTPPNKKGRGKRVRREKQDYDIREYVSSKEVKSVQKRLNLSQEEIEKDLMGEADETEQKTKSHEPLNLKYFDGSLHDYQIEGLKWLIVLYENGVNGILADEMGLGKTIQVIALICYLVQKKIPGPYLVIAPLSTIPNWLMEFEKFSPKIPVVLLHGTAEERSKTYNKINQKAFDVDGYKTHPVVLTTYEVPLQEQNFLKKQQWRYIVIDEGHRVKNPNCQLLQVLKKCQSMNRLLLTGTPLQNNLSELWSLLNFLLPEIFNDLAVFESWFDAEELLNEEGTERILKQEAEKKVLSSLREILKPFMLRRIKTDVCLDIPAKKEIVVYAPISELQHSLYEAVLNRDIETISKVKQDELIIEDIDGQRPLRKCRLKKDASTYMMDSSHSDNSRASTPATDDEDGTWKKKVEPENSSLTMWRKYTSVDERNRDFLIRVTGTHKLTMYKKIVNHPYLVHCPLNDAGLPKIDEDLINNSGKLLVLDAMLKKLKAGGHKVLLFSTWTQILDMIEDYLELRDYRYCRLDGNRKIEDRKENIKLFNSDPNVFLFLVSTRAGGVGLNLAAADTVIIYDSDWNPQADIQAMARCHRIGQTRPVVIYRFCTSGTIDERIIARAEAKRKLEKMVISKDVGRLNPDLGMLLEMKKLLASNKTKIVKAENNVFTPEELDKILDRSDLIGKTDASTSE